MTYIARRECCCRAYKCDRIPNYGLPPHKDAQAYSNPRDGDDTVRINKPGPGYHGQQGVSQASPDISGHEQDSNEALRSAPADVFDCTADPTQSDFPVDGGSLDAAEKPGGGHYAKGIGGGRQPHEADCAVLVAGDPGPQKNVLERHGEHSAGADATEGTFDGRSSCGTTDTSAKRGQASASSTSGGSDGAVARSAVECEDASLDGNPEEYLMEKGTELGGEEARSGEQHSEDLSLAGRAIACREHALDGMVYLGQRYAYCTATSTALHARGVQQVVDHVLLSPLCQ